MVNYRLIIEYHQKGNNNTQVATLCSCSRTTVKRQGFTKNSISGREIGLTTHLTCDIIIVQIKRILHA